MTTVRISTIMVPDPSEDDEAALDCYVDYLSDGMVDCKTRTKESEDYGIKVSEQYQMLSEAYIFAVKIEDVEFQNTIMSALFYCHKDVDEEGVHWLPDSNAVLYIYRNTVAGSPLRRFVVDSFTWSGWAVRLQQNTSVPKEFLRELAMTLMTKHELKRRDHELPSSAKCSDYHVRKDDRLMSSGKAENGRSVEALDLGTDSDLDSGSGESGLDLEEELESPRRGPKRPRYGRVPVLSVTTRSSARLQRHDNRRQVLYEL